MRPTVIYCGILWYTVIYCGILSYTVVYCVIYCGILSYTMVYCGVQIQYADEINLLSLVMLVKWKYAEQLCTALCMDYISKHYLRIEESIQ